MQKSEEKKIWLIFIAIAIIIVMLQITRLFRMPYWVWPIYGCSAILITIYIRLTQLNNKNEVLYQS